MLHLNPLTSYHGSPASRVERGVAVHGSPGSLASRGQRLKGEWAKLMDLSGGGIGDGKWIRKKVGVRRGLRWDVLTWTNNSVIAGSLFTQRPTALRAVRHGDTQACAALPALTARGRTHAPRRPLPTRRRIH